MYRLFTSRPLTKSASGVLASLRGSTLRGMLRIFEILKGLIRSPRFIARANGYTKCGPYLLSSSLAAALLDGLSEQPAGHSASVSDLRHDVISGVISWFVNRLLACMKRGKG
jgi:hypothetical protein